MISLVRKFLRTVVPAVVRPLHILWNEIIGFLFLVLSIWACGSAIRSWREHDGSADSFFRLIMSVVFALVMGAFAIGSFRRARKISKS